MVETGLCYQGEVTLTFKIGDKVIRKKTYNKGWSPLFRLIALTLTGNMSNENLQRLKPTYVDMRFLNNGGDWETCLFSMTPTVPSYYYEEDSKMADYGGINYISAFTCTISFSNLDISKTANFNDSTDCRLFLLSGEVGSASAEAVNMASLWIDALTIKEMQAGSQVIVDWTMKFYNI